MRRLALLLPLAACGAAPRGEPVANELAPAAVDYLVWTDAGTTWVDASGEVRGHAPGVVIAAGGSLWRLSSDEVSVPLRTCDEIEREPMPAPSGAGDVAHGVEISLRELGGDRRLAVGAPPADEGFAQLDWGSSLIGSVGPYLFAETAIETYGCGAHGNHEVIATSYDLAARAARPIVSDADAAPSAPEAATALSEALGAELSAADVHHGETRPVWRVGTLGAAHLFWADACYACSTGDWSSYTAAVWVDALALPPAFAALPTVPRAVAALAATTPSGISWGTPTDRWRAAFAE
jgi:hypothetical protein